MKVRFAFDTSTIVPRINFRMTRVSVQWPSYWRPLLGHRTAVQPPSVSSPWHPATAWPVWKQGNSCPRARPHDCCLYTGLIFSSVTYCFLQYVVVVAYMSTPVTKMGVKPAVCWRELRFIKSQMPFTDGSRSVIQVFKVLRQEFFLKRQTSRFCCQDGESLHSWWSQVLICTDVCPSPVRWLYKRLIIIHPSIAEVRNEWSYTSTFPVRLYGVHRDRFTCAF